MNNNLPEARNIMETKSGLIPTNINEAMQLSEILAQSDIVPKTFIGKPNNVFVAISWGIEIGLSPMQSLQNIAVINGNPSLWGDASIALVRGSGLLQSIKETQNDAGATCVIQRVGEDPHTYTFTREDARIAGLLTKDNYKKYPKRMFQMRARSFALRDVFPDVLKGLRLAEEEEDAIETEVVVPKPTQEEPAEVRDPLQDTAKKNKETVTEAEVIEEQKPVVTVKAIQTLYVQAEPQKQAKIGEVMAARDGWKNYSSDDLAKLYEELRKL